MRMLGQTCASMARARRERRRPALGALEGAMVMLVSRRGGDDTNVNAGQVLMLKLYVNWLSLLARI